MFCTNIDDKIDAERISRRDFMRQPSEKRPPELHFTFTQLLFEIKSQINDVMLFSERSIFL